jgi:NADP-dependent 3-hydroxy acid dehydrogenase YdfG
MKHIFITGASSGIGKAIAENLHSKGYALTLFARNAQALEEIKNQLGERVFVTTGDIRNASAVREAIAQSVAHYGQLDGLVNNAGLGYFDPLQQAKLEHWHEMIDTNVKGILNAFHAAMPHLIEARGHVINIGSVASHLVFPNSGIYSATKHAVLAISESIRMELSGKIGVTTISPGSVNTPFIEQTTNAQLLQELRPGFAGGLAPETIAEQIAFVLAHEGRAIINEIIIRPDKRG